MKAPLSWLAEHVELPEGTDAESLAETYFKVGLEVEEAGPGGADVTGPVVVGKVLTCDPEPQKNGKTINWCTVDVGEHNQTSEITEPGQPRGIVCGAHNFGVGDLVVVSLPGAELPGGFVISARKTYGHVSDGMICSTSELGLGEDRSGGILVLSKTDDSGRELVPGEPAVPLLHLSAEVIDVNVTPDLGYCLSVRGLAREAAQAYGTRFTDPVDRDTPAPKQDGWPVRLDDDRCSLFVALGIDGLDPSRPTPRWMSRRLQLAGMRSVSLLVDITNYVMLETGQPLHAYDAAKLSGDIVVRAGVEGEKFTTLDDVERTLSPADCLVTDADGVISMLVMGGARAEVSDTTTSIVLEAASYDAVTIARTSRRARLSSEASRRFERGVDPNAAYSAAHRAAALMAELAGGTVSPDETVAGTLPTMPTTSFPASLPGQILGAEVSTDEVLESLRGRGITAELRTGDAGDDTIEVTPPTWRSDLTDPYDYVEEVGCAITFDRIPAVLPKAPGSTGLSASQVGRRHVNSAVVAAGFTEVLNFPFLGTAELDQLRLGADDPRRAVISLANPISEVQSALRTTLLPGLLAAAARNHSRSLDDVALFEIGAIFDGRHRGAAPVPPVTRRPGAEEISALFDAVPNQPRHAAALLTGNWLPAGPGVPAQKATWRHAVHFADVAARAVGLELTRQPAEQAPWHPGRCAALLLPGAESPIGWAGELHPEVCKAFGVPARSCAVEFDLDALIEVGNQIGTVTRLATFPMAKEDVALIVDEDASAAGVQRSLTRGAGELLESIRLFDVYRGEQVGEGKKSLAFALRFRSPDRTLTDAEAAQARNAAVAEAEADFGAVLRS